jgi:AcrR family transcriptional regulator
MGTYLKMAERKALARAAARELLASGVPFQDLTLRDVAGHLGWALGTLHRAYSVMSALLNDLLLEYEGATFHAVYLVGTGGLRAELASQARRMRDWMADPAHVQLMRYQMSLGCRSEDPNELSLRQPRGSSWAFHRDVLVQVGAAAGEEYADLEALASLVAAVRDGSTYQFFSHGDPDRWLADNLRGIDLAVGFARPRRARTRATPVDRRWVADPAPGPASGVVAGSAR